MSRVTVIGAGFGALTAVRKLRAADARLHIDLIAPQPEFHYYPGTIWIPTGLREPGDLVVLDVDEEIARGLGRQGPRDLVAEIGLDQRDGEASLGQGQGRAVRERRRPCRRESAQCDFSGLASRWPAA